MKMKMKRCNICMIYTIEETCPKCGGSLNVIYPPKYSIEDKYGKYRRKLKEELNNQ
ncbi:RNA-protein complex protein Nop10 [Methanobrevibacter curvatus]|uniref:Ribosome biogenesis protein Nop10 n=1 Tax=Methanobrevibacter curvatus TaxID=49547 RepID=A0A166ELJ4_9EURY|nr:RNA-protein complex protein Nop10 [Methanobrevibacter curvatus]KZX16789.1 H/ACA RNA-protein complex component Nop10p [Methanobrevibacter curvatus]